MNDRIKDYFSFNKKEQRGLIILLGLLLLSVSANLLLPGLLPEKEFDITPFQKEVEEFLATVSEQDSINKSIPHKYGLYNNEEKESGPYLSSFKSSPFNFDPNVLNEEQWLKMDMDPALIRNILRYREKGGKFRDKDGFRKIYGMNDSVFSILSPYIIIEEDNNKFTTTVSDSGYYNNKYDRAKSFTKFEPERVNIELNSADSASLLSLNGIGPSFAGRITRYRNRLGGFISVEQLLEINGMDSIRFNQFKMQVTVDPLLVRKLDLNTVAFKELLRHPYFEYYLVRAVFNYKDEIKAYDSVEQLRKIPVMYEELYQKIAPYLEVKR